MIVLRGAPADRHLFISMKPHLTICGVGELRTVLDRTDPERPITHVVSIWGRPVRRSEVVEMNHFLALFEQKLPGVQVLPLEFEDIAQPEHGLAAPGRDHLASVLAFAREALLQQDEQTHILVHCQMGVSRSTACALAILAQANPEVPSRRLFSHLRSLRKWLCPNQRLVRIADELLARTDPLLEAVQYSKQGIYSSSKSLSRKLSAMRHHAATGEKLPDLAAPMQQIVEEEESKDDQR